MNSPMVHYMVRKSESGAPRQSVAIGKYIYKPAASASGSNALGV